MRNHESGVKPGLRAQADSRDFFTFVVKMSIFTIAGHIGTGTEILALKVARAIDNKIVGRRDFEKSLNEYGIIRFTEKLDSAPPFS